MRKSEEPLVVHRSLTWWLTDVCGSPREDHHRALAACIRQVPHDWKRPAGRPIATLGSMQLRQTLALWTLASRLPGERPLLETNGDIWWTQQPSSRVRSERRRRADLLTVWAVVNRSCRLSSFSLKWFLLHHIKSDSNETCCGWYMSKGLQSYRAGVDWLHTLC